MLDGDVGYGRPVSDNLKLQVPLPYFDPLLDRTKGRFQKKQKKVGNFPISPFPTYFIYDFVNP